MTGIRPPGDLRPVASLTPGNPLASDVTAFARSTAGRHGRTAVRGIGTERVFLRPAIRLTTILNRHRTFVRQGAPRVAFHLRLGPARRHGATVALSPGPDRLRPGRGQLVSSAGSEERAIPTRERGEGSAQAGGFAAAQRVERRARGGEPVAEARPPVASAPASHPTSGGASPVPVPVRSFRPHADQPVETTEVVRSRRRRGRVEDRTLVSDAVVLRRAHKVAEAAIGREVERLTRWQESPARAPSRRPAHPPSPQLDLATVTNQVMREIDRRLGAWRERTGRV